MTWFLIDDVALKQLHRINVVCECAPPGLLLSLGDGSAVERSAEDLARAVLKVGGYEDTEPSKVELRSAVAIIAVLLDQAKPKPAVPPENRCPDCGCKIGDGFDICGNCSMDRDMGDFFG